MARSEDRAITGLSLLTVSQQVFPSFVYFVCFVVSLVPFLRYLEMIEDPLQQVLGGYFLGLGLVGDRNAMAQHIVAD